jgi:hypothetical protein
MKRSERNGPIKPKPKCFSPSFFRQSNNEQVCDLVLLLVSSLRISTSFPFFPKLTLFCMLRIAVRFDFPAKTQTVITVDDKLTFFQLRQAVEKKLELSLKVPFSCSALTICHLLSSSRL